MLKIVFLLIFTTLVFPREKLFLRGGNEVSIIADKAYYSDGKKLSEAIGNVIINKGGDTLYGETAAFYSQENKIEIKGNVRFTTKDLTIYGSELSYNFDNNNLSMTNARIISNSFSVHGKEIKRIGESKIIARYAEYTSCNDCPESWAVYGDKVEITLNEYINVSGAIVKINGVPMLYSPFFIFPIKTKRQTGLLFPEFYSSSTIDGLVVKQPIFWAISDNKDVTLSPTIFGSRGYGGNAEYRYIYGEGKWLQIDNLSISDNKYNKNYIRGNDDPRTSYRTFGTYEHNYQIGNSINHHLIYQGARELDIINDYRKEVDESYNSNDLGLSGFIEAKSDRFSFVLESHFRENLIVEDPREFDHEYVQILPRVSMNMVPVNILRTNLPVFKSIDLSLNGDATVFKQNQHTDLGDNLYRNAHRYNFYPILDLNIGYIGPVKFDFSVESEYQRYRFPHAADYKNFEKWVSFTRSEASIEFDKIFGLAFKRELPKDEVEVNVKRKQIISKDSKIIGHIPEFENDLADDNITLVKNSYRHASELKLIHYQLAKSGITGNYAFKEQIKEKVGLFDYRDARREFETEIDSISSKKEIPKENGIEFQWNNIVIKKSPQKTNYSSDGSYLKDYFSYTKLFYFDISQGLDVSSNAEVSRDFTDKLSRLAISTGLSLDNFTISTEEFYFYNGKHIQSFDISVSSDYVDATVGFAYNSVDSDVPTNTLRVGTEVRPSSLYTLSAVYDLDLRSQADNNKEFYEVKYSPSNNCWELKVNYSDDAIETRVALDFQLKFNTDFTSLF